MSNRGRFDDALYEAEKEGDDEQAQRFRDQAWSIALAFGKMLAWEEADEMIECANSQAQAARAVAMAADEYLRTSLAWPRGLTQAVDIWRHAYVETGD